MNYSSSRCKDLDLNRDFKFCSSRKGTEETALHLLAKAMHGSYVQNDAQRNQLQDGANRVVDKQLQQALRGGVGFHHGNLEPQDRAIVENLFLNRAIMVSNMNGSKTICLYLHMHLCVSHQGWHTGTLHNINPGPRGESAGTLGCAEGHPAMEQRGG